MSYLGRSAKLSLKAQEKVSFLATAGQTSKTGLSYVPSFVEVYVNGILLTDTTDFTATNGNSVTFTVALALNDEVTVVSLKTFTVADHYTKSAANTLLAAKATTTALATTTTTANAALPKAGGTMTGAAIGAVVALTDASSIATNLALSNNFSVTLAGSRTLANPTNTVAGQSGSIFITQDGTGSRTLAYGSNFKFAGGTAPVLSTAANSVDRLDYVVKASTQIHAVVSLDVK